MICNTLTQVSLDEEKKNKQTTFHVAIEGAALKVIDKFEVCLPWYQSQPFLLTG